MFYKSVISLKHFLILILICLRVTNTIYFNWARLAGGASTDYGYAIATDKYGFIYVTGTTLSSSFDSMPTNGSWDAFIVKYSLNGLKIWSRIIGNVGTETSYSITTDYNGYIYIVGTTNSAVLDSQINNGGYDSFIIKFDNNGNKIWTNIFGGTGDDYALSISSDNSGFIYIAGKTTSNQFILNLIMEVGILSLQNLILMVIEFG